MNLSRPFQFLLLSIVLLSCASKIYRPELYPNQTLKERGEKSQLDIDHCLKEANEYLQTPEGKKLQKSAHQGSVSTSVGIGLGSSGGLGMGVGVGNHGHGSKLSGEEQVRRNFTNQCLVNKGYQIIGWD